MLDFIVCIVIGFVAGCVCTHLFMPHRSAHKYQASPKVRTLLGDIERQWGENGVIAALNVFNQRTTQQDSTKPAQAPNNVTPTESPQPSKAEEPPATNKIKKRKPNMDAFSLLREVSENDSVWSEHASDLRREGMASQFLPVQGNQHKAPLVNNNE